MNNITKWPEIPSECQINWGDVIKMEMSQEVFCKRTKIAFDLGNTMKDFKFVLLLCLCLVYIVTDLSINLSKGHRNRSTPKQARQKTSTAFHVFSRDGKSQ